jgi:hypothetical protein
MNIGDLKIGEPHPSAYSAMEYVKMKLNNDTIEAFASCAIEGNRLSEVCIETIRKIKEGEPVSDRYLLGLAWTLKEMEDKNDNTKMDKETN